MRAGALRAAEVFFTLLDFADEAWRLTLRLLLRELAVLGSALVEDLTLRGAESAADTTCGIAPRQNANANNAAQIDLTLPPFHASKTVIRDQGI